MRYSVGDEVYSSDLDNLDAGTKFEITSNGYFRITEIPELSPVDKLRRDLVELGYDSIGPRELAEWILGRFGIDSISDGPDNFYDRTGDKWRRNSDGTYTMLTTYGIDHESAEYQCRSFKWVRENWGPLKDMDYNSI